eukprot:1148777-Pelagomonas_calceolata.AAC.4
MACLQSARFSFLLPLLCQRLLSSSCKNGDRIARPKLAQPPDSLQGTRKYREHPRQKGLSCHASAGQSLAGAADQAFPVLLTSLKTFAGPRTQILRRALCRGTAFLKATFGIHTPSVWQATA